MTKVAKLIQLCKINVRMIIRLSIKHYVEIIN